MRVLFIISIMDVFGFGQGLGFLGFPALGSRFGFLVFEVQGPPFVGRVISSPWGPPSSRLAGRLRPIGLCFCGFGVPGCEGLGLGRTIPRGPLCSSGVGYLPLPLEPALSLVRT